MSSPVLNRAEGGRIGFRCPGCNDVHYVVAHSSAQPGWMWNGDMVRPTIQPSILVTSGHYASGHSGDCWCTYHAAHPDEPAGFSCYRCHSYVTNGHIQFLNDCTHALAGQTVPLPGWE